MLRSIGSGLFVGVEWYIKDLDDGRLGGAQRRRPLVATGGPPSEAALEAANDDRDYAARP